MKKILFTLFTITLLLTLSTSCQEDDPIVKDKGRLISATYHATYKTFTLTYSNGQTETVNAVIDNNTTPPTASATLDDGTEIYVKDSSQSGKATIGEKPDQDLNVVTQFVYDGMSLYYLWSNEVISKKPTANDKDPEEYFYKILNDTDTQHGWSWITDDVESLMAGFEGESTDAFGFQPQALYYESNSDRIVGFVRYVYPNTPAEKAGIKRGDVITHANGNLLTVSNYTIMYGANAKTTFTVLDQNFANPRDVEITPAKISTDPVLYSKVYEGEGFNGRKVGYLFYTNFYENYNESLFRAFSEFKSAGITDLVLDLRYNPGGGISAATYLASLIAPIEAVQKKEPFTILSFNEYLNKEYGDSRKYNLGEYNSTEYSNPINANINNGNLNLYVITTSSSASASELITFCLMPYMQVEHIGEKTSGKYTASQTIHAYNSFPDPNTKRIRAQRLYVESGLSDSDKNKLKDWAIQPIVATYTNKYEESFMSTNGLIPNHPIAETDGNERNTAKWKPIGDTDDYLFAKAISLITGNPYTVSQTRSALNIQLQDAELYSPMESVFREGVIIDAPTLITPLDKK